MSTTPEPVRRFVLTEYVNKIRAEGSIPVDLGEHGEVVIPPPLLWPEPMPRGMENQQKAILGEEQYARWKAAGGNGKLLDAIINEAQGSTTGE